MSHPIGCHVIDGQVALLSDGAFLCVQLLDHLPSPGSLGGYYHINIMHPQHALMLGLLLRYWDDSSLNL